METNETPGQYPYTRGPYATMYRGQTWTMRQIAGFGTAEDADFGAPGGGRSGWTSLGFRVVVARHLRIDEVDGVLRLT